MVGGRPMKIAARLTLVRHQCLDRRRPEFSDCDQGGGLAASPDFVSMIGALLPNRAVGSFLVVVSTPILQLFSGIFKAKEPMRIAAHG